SVEPLLEDLGALDLRGIHWVIVGFESGPGFRPMDYAWARSIRDQCVAAGVPFFFKQSAARRTEVGTRLVEADGSTTVWHQDPCEFTPPKATHASLLLATKPARCAPAPRQLPLGLARPR